jgi:NADH:ubiquinone oxidoreductase subunit F (NADH-binding)
MTTLDLPMGVADLPALFTVAEPRLFARRHEEVPARDQQWLVDAASRVRLLGRGGAAFPVATKLAAVRKGARVVVNGSEGEPASWKDRALMRRYPDLVVAGVALVGTALRSRRMVIAVTDAPSASALRAAVRRHGAPIEVREVEHGFVGGEIRALINGLNQRTPVPDGVRVLPHERGLDDRSTYASNVETFAQLALLSALGPDAYAATGTQVEPGTSLLTLHGTGRDGVLEVPNGMELSRLLGSHVGPVLVGGYHGTWTTREDLIADRAWLREQGIGWGAGVVAVLPEDTCPVGEIARVAGWLAQQSARQCGPCAFGLPAIAQDLARLSAGEVVDADRLRTRLGQVSGRGACHHPTGAIGFIGSGLNAFDADVRRHLAARPCGQQVRGILPLGTAR